MTRDWKIAIVVIVGYAILLTWASWDKQYHPPAMGVTHGHD